MTSGFFHTLQRETPTRFWINNPTARDAELAIAAGAINCTTNPAYGSKLLAGEPDYIRQVIDDVLRRMDDDDQAAEAVAFQSAQRIMRGFLPLYEASRGDHGYVTIQGDPRRDEDTEYIVAEAMRARTLGPNFMSKIPATAAGCRAIDTLIARDVPICATEVFTIAQAIHVCELYERVSASSGHHPPFYVTHITGILDDYWQNIVSAENIRIEPEVLGQAGVAVARREYQILRDRGYHVTMLGGGARAMHHFTDFIGGEIHITVNWSTAEEIMAADVGIAPRMNTPIPAHIIHELESKLPGFTRAYHEGGLSPERFKDFGGLVHFRNQFMAGYARLLEEVAARRALL